MTAVVTGIGVAAPTGLGVEEFWAGTLKGASAIGPITRFDASGYPVGLAGEISGFDAAAQIPGRLLPQTDRVTQLALAATGWGLADADVDPARFGEFDMGVVTAGSIGGFEFGQRELQALWRDGPEHVSVYQSFAWFYAVNTGQISIRHGMRGPTGVLVTEQAGGLDALAQARRRVRAGTGLVVSGGMEAPLCPWGVAAHVRNGGLSRSRDRDRAFLPFDAGAGGHVIGEGGAMLIVEDAGRARERGAPHVYGEIAGYCATFDPPGGTRLAEAITGALDDAGVDPSGIGAVFADASGVPSLDLVEAEAIRRVFGKRSTPVPVTAPKTMFGRLSSGGGPVDVAAALLALRDGVVPPTVNVGDLAPGCELDLVREARPVPLSAALVIARGHHGFNSALVVRSAA
ncbi:ketosynthase chain-length factor [Actinomadura formosensis]|uniref:ketosynthase chain-length factor n=1 Tax=Actinomadura formosensis TaxID=60706 RepID=UPI003D8BCEA3